MNIINNVYKYRQVGRSWFQRPVSQITTLTVHHDAFPHSTKTAHTIMGQIMKVHSDKGWPGMSYHYYIHTDGKVYQTNNHTDITWHDSVNNDSIGIVLTGYFHPTHNNQPTQAQKDSLYQLLDHLQNTLGGKKVVGHRDRGATACPGDNLYPFVKSYKKGDSMSDDLMQIKKSDFEKLLNNSLAYDEYQKQFTSPAQAKQLVQGLKDDLNKEKSRVKEADARADGYKKELEESIAEIAKLLNVRQELIEVTATIETMMTEMDKLEDFKKKHAGDSLEWAKNELTLKQEIARLEALLKQQDILENVELSDLLKELVKRLKAIMLGGK
jgi:N-acetyl-anhydromuramyl-L-alanine amidase AmpD